MTGNMELDISCPWEEEKEEEEDEKEDNVEEEEGEENEGDVVATQGERGF